MLTRDRVLCWVYGVLALAALVATWSQNIRFFSRGHSLWDFVKGGYVNPAAASLTNDLLLICLAAWVFMVVEARRVGVRYVWAYIAGSLLIAVSVMFPLFLLARQLRLSSTARS